jgi:hypothetical protein
LKGFKKDGKFRPTGSRNTSSLTKKDVEHQHADDRIGRTLPLTRKKVGSCKTCGMKFTNKDYENASAGRESPVGDYDDECYPCQLRDKKSLDKVEDPKVSKELKQLMKEEIGVDDVEAFSYNPEWKLTHLYEGGYDGAEYYHFPDEESALKFGRQSIRDTARDYLPDEYETEEQKEWKGLKGEELVDKILEVQSDYGMRSELGAMAQSVASYDGQYSELSDGSIIFRIS